MNTKSKAFDKKIAAQRRQEADLLVEQMADLIMQNTWLAAEVARRWAEKNGYYFTDRTASDNAFKQRYPGLARQ